MRRDWKLSSMDSFHLYARSSDHDHHDSAVSGSGDLSNAGGHTDSEHHGHAHPGTVLFLFVAIAVGGEQENFVC